MAQHINTAGHHGGTGETHHAEHHVVSIKTYLLVFGALMVLLFLTVGASYVDFVELPAMLGGRRMPALAPLNIIVAMAIAITKAALILLFFMHIKYSSRLIAFVAVAGLLWLAILFAFTFADYFSRDWIPQPGTWTMPSG